MASSSQTIASSGISYGCSYDVFINFRGVDTRENFVCLLHDGLRRDGFHAFIDSEDLWEGEEIRPSLLKAIQGSKISIPIFSKHYADSKYCLLELAEIWDCCLTQDQTILPIFIDVEPREVENQSGSFEGPFQKYKSKCKPTVEDWENALTKVGKIKGWHLKQQLLNAEEDEEGAKEAYFLRSSVGWSDANDDEEVDEEDADDDEEVDKEDADDDEEIEDGHEEVDEEEEHALSASNYMETFLDGEDNQYEEEFLEEGKNRAVCCLSCFGF
ncbi:hypothetical protein NE237_001527 [Protea cynaroides]|uniref:ADP-ribosyl cyclase/cyclic ADP-ribose hydrolase n=1 Tax=Protea cynaroides TaxID=273540 RepID=A0A9Q0KTI2_9MAGN|nr:hypothetical protein NE237_001527 [Protea cynaroides]